MNLRDFIKEALEDIILGVEEANSKIGKRNGVWPFGLSPGQKGAEGQGIEFDVALTGKRESGAEGKSSGILEVFGITASGKTSKTSEQVSRVKFRVSTEAWVTKPPNQQEEKRA